MAENAMPHLDPAVLAGIAERAPHAEALRHKRHGVWLSWSWSDLGVRGERLAQALQARGIGAGSLVALSGDYGPNLVLFAIAALRLGARVVTLPVGITRIALAEWLEDANPGLVFLGQRDQLAVWRAVLRQAEREATLVVDFHLPWGHPSGAEFSFAAELLGEPSGGAEPVRPACELLWIEEGTDWGDGLAYIFHAAIASGRAIAFPESRVAAGRDRREVQPVSIALSRAHRAALARDLASRLPTGNGVAARLTRNALAAGQAGRANWPQRWLLRRVRRPFGLARLLDLTVVAADGDAEAAGDLFTALGIREGYASPPADAAAPARTGLVFA
jgi:hypothetical protein